MHYLITADITDPRRLRRVARMCERWGERVQESVYLMEFSPEELYSFQAGLARLLHGTQDTVRYYALCAMDMTRSGGEGLGQGLARAPSHWLI